MAIPVMKYSHLVVAGGCLYTLYRSAGGMKDADGELAFGRIVFFGAIYSAMATISFVFMIAHSAGCPILIELELWYDAVLATGLVLSTLQIQKMKERLIWPGSDDDTEIAANARSSLERTDFAEAFDRAAASATNSKTNDQMIHNMDMLVINQQLGILAAVALAVDFLIQMFCTHDFVISATSY